jgi:hypothetical protein
VTGGATAWNVVRVVETGTRVRELPVSAGEWKGTAGLHTTPQIDVRKVLFALSG